MFQYLIFSDSHGDPDVMRRVFVRHRDVLRVLFLGDGLGDAEAFSFSEGAPPVIAVRGNCDSFTSPYGFSRPNEQVISVAAHKVLLLHGHTAGAKSGIGGLVAKAREFGADVVLFGHTHQRAEVFIPEEEGGPLWLFNPGSIGEPPDGIPSYGLMTVNGKGELLFSHGDARY